MLDKRLYRELLRIRRVEEEIARVYPSDKIMSPIHLSIGQEAVSVGVCQALQSDDVVFGTYRSHAYYLAKGGSLRGMIAELYGKATGVAKGKAGSMHLIDPAAGVMGASAIVASTIPQAVGYALALQTRGERRVVVVFFGEGATEEGVFYESLNFAALRRLPVLFVCENNFYAIHSRQRDRQAVPDICRRAAAQGVLTQCFPVVGRISNPSEESIRLPDGRIGNPSYSPRMDIYELYVRTCQVVEELRAGESPPVLFECHCYRWREHVGPGLDYASGYRAAEELEPWLLSDPLVAVGGKLTQDERRCIQQEIEEEIDDAFHFAEHSPFPGAEELYTDLYA
jgi:TPP-dependent pyruvate/acetoin dehydrogenase alpha subunit